MMQPEQIYSELRNVAEKLGITVSEQNLRKNRIHVKSGLCKVKDKTVFVMDKHETIYGKNRLLASCLQELEHEDLYVVPAVRALLEKPIRKRTTHRETETRSNETGTLSPEK